MVSFSSVTEQVQSLFVAYYGRAGDPMGTQFWANAITSGQMTLSAAASQFAKSSEATSKYPYLAAPRDADSVTFVTQVYQSVFNHAPDAAGLAFWVSRLNANSGNATAVGMFIKSIIDAAQGTDGMIITNKVLVATDFTQKTTSAGTGWGPAMAERSSTEISATDSTQASVNAQKAATTAYVASVSRPQPTPASIPRESPASIVSAKFEQPIYVNDPTTCYFYHTMDLPTLGVMKGEWDLRGEFADYTNSYDFKGKRVLDIGAGSGFLSFAAENAGAREVVSFDMDDSYRQDFLPFHDNLAFKDRQSFARQHNAWIAQWRNAYWLSHRLLRSKARVYYGDVYALPPSLGQFDVTIIGSILEHLADPIKALSSISRVTSNSMIIVTPMLDTDEKIAEFRGDCERPRADFVFWVYSRGIYYHVLSMLGFRIDRIVGRSFIYELDGRKRHGRYVITATR